MASETQAVAASSATIEQLTNLDSAGECEDVVLEPFAELASS
jgi:hypothetical protein